MAHMKRSLLAMLLMLCATPVVARYNSNKQKEGEKKEKPRKDSECRYREITSEKEFTDALSKNGVTVVKFHAPWCSACKNMKPHYEKVSEAMQANAQFLAVNTEVEQLQDLARTFNVKGLPTTIIITKHMGALSEEELTQEVLNALGKGHLPRSTGTAVPAKPAKETVEKKSVEKRKRVKMEEED